MEFSELNHYLEVVIPSLEDKLSTGQLDQHEFNETFELYTDVLRIVARDDFATFNKYLEIDEDHTNPKKAFFHHRQCVLSEVTEALNDMEIHDLYDL